MTARKGFWIAAAAVIAAAAAAFFLFFRTGSVPSDYQVLLDVSEKEISSIVVTNDNGSFTLLPDNAGSFTVASFDTDVPQDIGCRFQNRRLRRSATPFPLPGDNISRRFPCVNAFF